MDVYATGPDMWLGKIGHFLIILGFISAIVSAIGYWMSAYIQNDQRMISWKNLGKTWFVVHGLSVLGVVAVLFYLMATKKYVFSYVYQHASNDLPFRYLFAAFWEGQEGSTLLWAFWHVILGFVLLFTTRKWQSPVLGTVALVQVFLLSMVMGLYVFDVRIGVNPFQLLKSTAANAPIFLQNPNFVPQDGKGLNELLRNYWMVIHPPIVFLGFAATSIPFGYALGGLLWRKLTDWITPALPWTLLAGGVLGIGVLMGGAWAYESLSFGGFWAWDPVENASLVPWLIIVAALHVMLVFRATNYSGITTFLLVFFSFLFVAYSTFLTKSGVLGESSVHSFTDLGMSGQLVVFILFFWVLAFTLFLSRNTMRWVYLLGNAFFFVLYLIIGQFGYILFAFVLFSIIMLLTIHDFPRKEKEEPLWSREFWLFLGSLVLFLSSMHIILATSTPVYNKLFGLNLSVFNQQHFNSMQIWPAIIMVMLSGVVLFLSYQKEEKITFLKQFLFAAFTALVFTIAIVILYKFKNVTYILLVFASLFSLLANASYLISKIKGKLSIGGSSIAHIGFAMLMLGVVISQSKKEIISKNFIANVNVNEDNQDLNENNVLLYEDETKRIGEYLVTLEKDVKGTLRDGVLIDFKETNGEKVVNEFQLIPKFKAMNDETLVADPAIKRGLFHDFFTHISLINLGNKLDSTQFFPKRLNPQDTIVYNQLVFIIDSIGQTTKRTDIETMKQDVTVSANMRMITKDSMYVVEPVYVIRGNEVFLYPDEIKEEKITVQLSDISPQNKEGVLEIGIKSARPFRKYILLKIMIFPLINLVWLGSILMFVGFMISLVNRRKQVIKRD